jgi:hypothetical protein
VAAYTSMKATPEAANALRRLALRASATAGRRLSMSAVLLAVCAVAEAHPDELTAQLAHGNGGT